MLFIRAHLPIKCSHLPSEAVNNSAHLTTGSQSGRRAVCCAEPSSVPLSSHPRSTAIALLGGLGREVEGAISLQDFMAKAAVPQGSLGFLPQSGTGGRSDRSQRWALAKRAGPGWPPRHGCPGDLTEAAEGKGKGPVRWRGRCPEEERRRQVRRKGRC